MYLLGTITAPSLEFAQLMLGVLGAQAKAGSVFRGAPPTQSYLRVSVGVAQGRSPGAVLRVYKGCRPPFVQPLRLWQSDGWHPSCRQARSVNFLAVQ